VAAARAIAPALALRSSYHVNCPRLRIAPPTPARARAAGPHAAQPRVSIEQSSMSSIISAFRSGVPCIAIGREFIFTFSRRDVSTVIAPSLGSRQVTYSR
jgi:hypothetical protein